MKSENGRTKRVTTSEIARLSGVSRATVSAVLNQKPGVRESTRRRVFECVREQEFESGIVAKSLVGELSRMVAVLAADVGSPFHMMVFQGINSVLGGEGYHLIYHNVLHENESDINTLAGIHQYRPAGYIVFRGAEGMRGEAVSHINGEKVPLVTIERTEGSNANAVYFDNRSAMKQAGDYVIAQGHRKLGYLAGPPWSRGGKERKLGFMESMVEHEIEVSSAMIRNTGEDAISGYEVALDMLRDPKQRPTALVCFNDALAMGVYRAAHELSLSIPQDVSVVGFDGIEYSGLLAPPLTTVDIFPHQLGQEAAHLLIRAMDRGSTRQQAMFKEVHPKLVERASVSKRSNTYSF